MNKTKINFRQKFFRRSSWLNEALFKKIIAFGLIEVDPVNIGVTLNIQAFLEGCWQSTRLEVKESQAVTTAVKIYFEPKIQCVKEFSQIGNEIPLILHGSINQIWTVALSCNAMSLLIVKETTNETNIFENCKMKRVIIFA